MDLLADACAGDLQAEEDAEEEPSVSGATDARRQSDCCGSNHTASVDYDLRRLLPNMSLMRPMSHKLLARASASLSCVSCVQVVESFFDQSTC